MNNIIRAIRVERGMATFVYMTEYEHVREGTRGVDTKSIYRMFCANDGNYRLVERCPYDHRCYDKRGSFWQDWILYRCIRPYLTRTCASVYMVTIMKYDDDTFTSPVDMPYDDPLVKQMKVYFSRT